MRWLLVTLDRVVCCYPDMEPLIKLSASKALIWYALSYARDQWWVRLAIRFENWRRRRAGDSFQVHIHSETLMDELIKQAGFSRQFHARLLGAACCKNAKSVAHPFKLKVGLNALFQVDAVENQEPWGATQKQVATSSIIRLTHVGGGKITRVRTALADGRSKLETVALPPK